MNPDRKINPHTEINTEGRGSSLLPRWARVPASIMLACLSVGIVDQAEAADPQCRVGVLSTGHVFFDNTDPNRINPDSFGLADREDFSLGAAKMGIIVTSYRDNPDDPKSPLKVVDRQPMIVKDGYSSALIDLTLKPNTKEDSNDAVDLSFQFEDDKVLTADGKRVEKRTVLKCNTARVLYSGRYATEEDIIRATKGRGFNKIGTVANQAAVAELKFSPQGLAVKNDNREENLKYLIKNIEEALKHGQDIREKERRLAQTATPSPTSTSTVTPTATPEAAPPPPGEETPPPGEETPPGDGKGFNIGNMPGLAWFKENLLPKILKIDGSIRDITGRMRIY